VSLLTLPFAPGLFTLHWTHPAKQPIHGWRCKPIKQTSHRFNKNVIIKQLTVQSTVHYSTIYN